MKQQHAMINHQSGMAVMLKAMAHPERLAIVNLMSTSDEDWLTVKFIYEMLELQQPVASRHLNILKQAGVVKRKQEGTNVLYSLCFDKKTMNALFEGLA